VLSFTIFLLATSLICFIMGILPSFTLLLAILWGTSLIIAGLYLKTGWMPILFGFNLLVLTLTAESSSVLFYLTFFGLAAFVMSFLVNLKEEFYQVQKWGIVSAVLGVSLFLGIIYYSTGDVGIAAMEDHLEIYITEAMDDEQTLGLLEFYEKQGISRNEIEKGFSDFAVTLSRHLPAFFYLQAILAVFFMLLLASYISIKHITKQLRKKPFEKEIMPWQVTWIAIIGLGLWLWDRDQMSFLYYAGSNILVILVPITLYYGTSIAVYKIKRQKTARKWILITIIILTVMLPLSVVILLSLLGLFDSLLDYRKVRLSEG